MLAPDAAHLVDRYLLAADRLLPGRVTGFYVVGSAALGAWHEGRSDIDFIAVLDGDFDGAESARQLRRLRLLHAAGNLTAAGRAVARARPGVPGTLNGSFVRAADLSKPVTQIRPVASHVGLSFMPGRGFDVNPVMWTLLRERGVTVRGPAPRELGLDPEPDRLRAWNLTNLHDYWRPWGEKALAGKPPRGPMIPPRWVARHVTAWGVLGPPRLHCTMATGEVISKEGAGEYALDTFASRWHPLIRLALAYRRGEQARVPVDPSLRDPARRVHATGEFVLEVIADAERL